MSAILPGSEAALTVAAAEGWSAPAVTLIRVSGRQALQPIQTTCKTRARQDKTMVISSAIYT